MSQPTSALINVINVKKYYKASAVLALKRRYLKVLDNITLEIRENEIVGCVGESGSGKSTLGRLLVGLEQPSEGKIVVRGKPLSDYIKERGNRRKFQMIFQNPDSSLNPRLTVRETLVEALKLAGEGAHSDEVVNLLHKVGLTEELLDRYPHQLSGGQKQRVAIARALAVKPEFIVADESVSSLDASIKARIALLFKQLQAKHNFSMLFISHDLPITALISDRIVVMYLGKVVEAGTTEEIIKGAEHPYTLHLLTSAPSLYFSGNSLPKIRMQGDIPSLLELPSGCRLHPRCPLSREECKKVEPEGVNLSDTHVVFCHSPVTRK